MLLAGAMINTQLGVDMDSIYSDSGECKDCSATLTEPHKSFCPHKAKLNVDGGLFYNVDVFAALAADRVPVWGDDDTVMWAEGEYMLLCGDTGVGKTTMGVQLIAARAGLTDTFLGFPVAEGKRSLWLHADRPYQLQQMLRDVFTEDELASMSDRFVVASGIPDEKLYGNFKIDEKHYYNLARQVEADTLVIDSLFNVVSDPNDFAVAKQFTDAVKYACENGVQTLVLHHPRKTSSSSSDSELSVDRVYGAQSFTASAGSVFTFKKAKDSKNALLRQQKMPKGSLEPIEMFQDWKGSKRFVVVSSGDSGDATVIEYLNLCKVTGEKGTKSGYASLMARGGEVTATLKKKAQRALVAAEASGVVSVDKSNKTYIYTIKEWSK